MYLLISDSYALTSERLYFNRNDVSFERIRQVSPKIVNISAEDIEEILIFAIRNTEGGLKVKTADCVNLTTDETLIRVDYGEIQEYDEICKNVRDRLFGNLVRSGRMKNDEFIPDIVLIDSIKDYNYIKVGKAGITKENQSWFNKVIELTQTREWNDIIAMSPSANEIEKTDFWNDATCLSKLSFALSKLATKSTRKASQDELKRIKQYGEYFLKVINRCIELEPNMSMHKSSLAYYYYLFYMSNKKEEYFKKALPLFQELSETSNEKYKEIYRYHIGAINWDGKYTAEWFSELKDVVEKYEWLIEEYQKLNEERQKKFRKHYIGALFQYAKVNINQFMKRAWDYYFNNVYARVEVKSYYIDDTQMQRINKSAEYLKNALELSPDKVNRNNIDDNPNYFELRYRLSQIEQIKGITLLMRGKPIEQCLEYFESSVKYADDVLNSAKELRNTGFRGFKDPEYVKPIKAISLFFLHDYNECHKCFINAKPYMLYEEARIFVLCNQIDEALRVLAKIPENDKCRNKANKFRDSLEGR
jgi:tetratricopeptide (TPR) repeat protein